MEIAHAIEITLNHVSSGPIQCKNVWPSGKVVRIVVRKDRSRKSAPGWPNCSVSCEPGRAFPWSRWGIILRSTVRNSDISWFSLLLLLQNGCLTDTRIGFVQKTASERVINSILAANKFCQSMAGYVSFETNQSDQANSTCVFHDRRHS